MAGYELLAPVGNFHNLRAAIDGGADAVYFGLRGFNMRAGAKNFSIKDLEKIEKLCKGDEKKISMYLTLNTIIYDGEEKKVEDLIKKVRKKIDAVICWDPLVIELCRKYGVEFHISTQASVSNSSSAKFYKKLGAKRIVLARELNLKQIKKISKIIDVECFAHGAMCVAISGRCFMSEHVHGLSANRGKCAQLCRRQWKITDDAGNELRLERSRVLSAKDLCTLPFIEKMKASGIKSFKIEGRGRSAEYVKTVVWVYRRALDKKLGKAEIEDGLRELRRVYNRGFSSGFYLGTPSSDDFSDSRYGEQEERKEFVGKVLKVWKKLSVGLVRLNAGKIREGDFVYLLGNSRSIQRSTVKSIEIDGKRVAVATKGQEAGVKFDTIPRKGEEVYVIRKVKR